MCASACASNAPRGFRSRRSSHAGEAIAIVLAQMWDGDHMGRGWWWVVGIGWLIFLAVLVVLARRASSVASRLIVHGGALFDILAERFAARRDRRRRVPSSTERDPRLSAYQHIIGDGTLPQVKEDGLVDATGLHVHDPVGGCRDVTVVGDHHDRDAGVRRAGSGTVRASAVRRRVEAPGRFIGEQDLGARWRGARERDPLAFPAGELRAASGSPCRRGRPRRGALLRRARRRWRRERGCRTSRSRRFGARRGVASRLWSWKTSPTTSRR